MGQFFSNTKVSISLWVVGLICFILSEFGQQLVSLSDKSMDIFGTLAIIFVSFGFLNVSKYVGLFGVFAGFLLLIVQIAG